DTPEIRRLKVLDLCKRARQSMEEGNWETADSLIGRAESFQVRWPLMYLGDRPEKVRKDYLKVRAKGGAMPSQQFKPNSTTTSAQPNGAAAPAGAAALASGAAPSEPTFNDPRAQARQALAKGRAELAQGNVAGATHWYGKASQAGATWSADEDSPDKLLVDI